MFSLFFCLKLIFIHFLVTRWLLLPDQQKPNKLSLVRNRPRYVVYIYTKRLRLFCSCDASVVLIDAPTRPYASVHKGNAYKVGSSTAAVSSNSFEADCRRRTSNILRPHCIDPNAAVTVRVVTPGFYRKSFNYDLSLLQLKDRLLFDYRNSISTRLECTTHTRGHKMTRR